MKKLLKFVLADTTKDGNETASWILKNLLIRPTNSFAVDSMLISHPLITFFNRMIIQLGIFNFMIDGQKQLGEEHWKMRVDVLKKMLLDIGLDPNVTDHQGNTGLHKLLADNVVMNCHPSRSNVALKSLLKIVQLFFAAGFKLDQRNNESQTVFDIMTRYPLTETFLLSKLNASSLSSLAISAVPLHLIPHLGRSLNYPKLLIESIIQCNPSILTLQ